MIRIINTQENDGFYNMAVDEAIFECFKKNASAKRPVVTSEARNLIPNTLRFYKFKPPAITIGRYQKIQSVKCKMQSEIDIIRRPTGGRAVFHNGDIVYSFVFNGTSLYEGYKRIAEIFATTLSKFNIEAKICRLKNSQYYKEDFCFNSIARYELQVNNKKILGSAQKKENNTILQQGSLFVSVDFFSFIYAVKQTLESMGMNVIEDNLTEEENNLVNKLINKYKSKKWNYLL